jgi:WD40 repeat protein
MEHHNGSIYCVDWSRTSRLVATGSNDKMIKILVTPNFEESDESQWHEEAKEMELKGHKAIVRTVCFNPIDPTVLLSGGLMENEVKVWDTETGQNVANLQGHVGNIYSIKTSFDGSFAISVGTDKMIKIWDIRVRKFVD